VERLEHDDNREMNMDSLFPAIDTDKTIKNCKHFLAVTFPAMVRTSGKSVSDLKSPTVDDMPRQTSSDNGIERRIYQRLYAEQVVRRTIEAISHCSETSKQVLSYLYLDEYTDTMCYMSIGYSRSHYFDHVKPAALLEFADAYLLDDLHVLKEGEHNEI